MDLSVDVQNSPDQFKFLKNRNKSVSPLPSYSRNDIDLDTIDESRINLGSDEYWLYSLPNKNENPVENLHEWLHADLGIINEDFLTISDKISNTEAETQKNIDTRTFTRPKKRFTRPSIEKYNEEVYGTGNATDQKHTEFSSTKNLANRNSGGLHDSFVIKEDSEPDSTKPISFDLTQPTSSYYFNNVLAHSGDPDSFQNMSPPSLVNSMCSSTFANLMDSSFIKNDPVLREIRDTDFTECVLLQDSEPPMFQSITESCSSIASDSPESFLKKVSFSGSFRKNMSNDFKKVVSADKLNISSELDTTYEKSNETESHTVIMNNTKNESSELNNQTFNNFNGTYRRSSKPNGTFRKTDVKNISSVLNSTFDISSNEFLDRNTTQTLIKDCSIKSFDTKKLILSSRENTEEDLKSRFAETPPITDLNRLSYCIEVDSVGLDSGYKHENDLDRTVNIARSKRCSSGSADSLDRMSSLSSSSRGSNKMLNMADVDAIVEMQERSLQQVMSTPNTKNAHKKLWENNFISPIISIEPLSDSDRSSNDEYKSVRSSISKTSLENYSSKPAKSLGYLDGPTDTKIKTHHRSAYTLTGPKPLQVIPSNMRGSYTNLRSMQSNIPGSQTNLYKPNNRLAASTSNLKTMGPKLKGSYTSLRPISANLPVAPPINRDLDTTTILPRASDPNVTQYVESRTKVVEVLPMPRGKVTIVGDHNFIKPQPPRASGLPRPTGIPRPASKIPGPRSSNIRPVPSRPTSYRRDSKDVYQ